MTLWKPWKPCGWNGKVTKKFFNLATCEGFLTKLGWRNGLEDVGVHALMLVKSSWSTLHHSHSPGLKLLFCLEYQGWQFIGMSTCMLSVRVFVTRFKILVQWNFAWSLDIIIVPFKALGPFKGQICIHVLATSDPLVCSLEVTLIPSLGWLLYLLDYGLIAITNA